MGIQIIQHVLVLMFLLGGYQGPAAIEKKHKLSESVTLSGELKKWHPVTLTFEGPKTSESANPNPFTYYRLEVTFRNDSVSYTVPGYYAADGHSAQTSATGGSKWRVHFTPGQTGRWQYEVSFRKGEKAAISSAENPGESGGYMDGETGFFTIRPAPRTANEARARGRLRYVGERYLQYAETGTYFLKAGADAPENFLAYEDFDGTFKNDGHKDQLVKSWQPHIFDWHEGDPTWQDGKGKGIIGAINYLAAQKMNAFSFLTMNIGGDDRNVFPYNSYEERHRFDVSKLDQWEIVFRHADSLGMFLHFKTQETENDHLLDEGALGPDRKLYIRQLVSRFSHHLALNWNFGEENTQTIPQVVAMADYFRKLDPYDHPIVIHTYPDQHARYGQLIGNQSALAGASIQTSNRDFSTVHETVLKWVKKSKKAGKPWVISLDEPGDAEYALVPDAVNPEHTAARKNALWGALMAGGAGVEWYFGYAHEHSDLTCEDWRSRANMWRQSRIALSFFREYLPFREMQSRDKLTRKANDYVLAKEDEIYAIYIPDGQPVSFNLEADASFSIGWFNPRTGGKLTAPATIAGNKKVTIAPPRDDGDWVALIRRR